MKSLRSISIVLMAFACMLLSIPLVHAADPGDAHRNQSWHQY